MSYLDHGSVAVIIDCWEYSQYPVNSHNYEMCRQLTDNILTIIPGLPNLTAVVLATYDGSESHDPETRSQNLYYSNTQNFFFHEQPIPYIKRWYQHDFVREHPRNNNTNYFAGRTDPSILHHVWSCQQLAMNDAWQLEYYIQHHVPHVKNIFYFGRNWTNWFGVPGCVLGRPIGADRLAELKKWGHLPDTNILVHQKGILDKRHPDDIFVWPDFSKLASIDKDIYQYC